MCLKKKNHEALGGLSRSTMGNMLTDYITVWNVSSSAPVKKTLQGVIKAPQKNQCLPSALTGRHHQHLLPFQSKKPVHTQPPVWPAAFWQALQDIKNLDLWTREHFLFQSRSRHKSTQTCKTKTIPVWLSQFCLHNVHYVLVRVFISFYQVFKFFFFYLHHPWLPILFILCTLQLH